MLKVTPLNMEITAFFLSVCFRITAKVVSIEVAPAEAIGANRPKSFTIRGVNTKVEISRTTLLIKEIGRAHV